MYGLCHHGIREFAIERFGQDTWQNVMQNLELVGDIELAAYYNDDVTNSLLGELVKESGLEADDILQQFGEYWIGFTQSTEHGRHMDLDDSAGLMDFLSTVNDLHARLLVILPELVLPDFEVEQLAADRFLLHYRSSRIGLAPMVLGLIRSLANHYSCKINIQPDVQIVATGSYVIFDIKHQASSSNTAS